MLVLAAVRRSLAHWKHLCPATPTHPSRAPTLVALAWTSVRLSHRRRRGGGMLAVLHRPPDVWQSPAQSIVQSIDSIDSRLFVEPQTPGCILYVRSGQPRLRVGEQHWWSAPNLTAQRSAPWSNPVSTTCGDHHRPPNVQRCRAHRCKPSCILDLTWPSAYKG